MPADKLYSALMAVDWNENVAQLSSFGGVGEALFNANYKLALWSRQLERTDEGNPALSFVREMQHAGQSVSILLSLGLYKSAAGSMRTALEAALYYSYFRSHPVELATLARESGYYIGKSTIFEYHMLHTQGFKARQTHLCLKGQLDEWYSYVSSIIHGQLPGHWNLPTSISDIGHDKETLVAATEVFSRGTEILHRLLLITVAQELWAGFSSSPKKLLLKGFTGDMKTLFGLDAS